MFKSPRPDQSFQGDRTLVPVPFYFWITLVDNLLANPLVFHGKPGVTFGWDAANLGQDAVYPTLSHVGRDQRATATFVIVLKTQARHN